MRHQQTRINTEILTGFCEAHFRRGLRAEYSGEPEDCKPFHSDNLTCVRVMRQAGSGEKYALRSSLAS
ncbi:hypothetical protein [Pantoea anthophila]|uniref:hypothetical protein n=1 Tax=Pantoea anthophila TaxID=470931 RepID=UPI003019ED86